MTDDGRRAGLTPDQIAPLVRLLEDADPGAKVLGLRALTAMPLSDGAWIRVGEVVLSLIEGSPDLDLLAVATRVPVVEVRRRIHRAFEAASEQQRRVLAAALAEVCDDAGVEVLTTALMAAESDDERAPLARALARFSPSDPDIVQQVLGGSDSNEVILWLAVHLARGGHTLPILRLLDAAAGGRFDAGFLGGDPSRIHAGIRGCVPLPTEVVEAADAGRGSSRLAAVLVAGLDASRPGAEPTSSDEERAAIQRACFAHDNASIEELVGRVTFSEVLEATMPLVDDSPAEVIRFVADVARLVRHTPDAMVEAEGAALPRPSPDDLIALPRASMPPDVDAGFDDGLESLRPPAETGGGTPGDESAHVDSDDVYALLDCPALPVAGDEFELVAGLSPHRSDGVQGGPLEGLGGRQKPYILSMQVVADGFALRADERWRHDLAVTDAQPHPQVTLHLTPQDQSEPVRPALIAATYTVDGQIVGTATRAVAVVTEGADTPEVDGRVQGADFSIPTSPVAPDLTVVLHKTRELHLLRMTIESPHASVPIPDADVEVDIGGRPDEYAQNLVRAMDGLEGRPELRRDLKGRGRTLAGSLPTEFWDALRAAAAESDGPPTLLLVSAEGRVPWELSIVDPPLDPKLPPFLSTQTVMGRWALGDTPLPPPHEHPFGAMAVITGDYDELARWETLQAAFDERDALQREYEAEAVDANFTSVMELLERDPAPSIVHLAVHGKYNPGAAQEGLILTDGSWLTPNGVRAEKIAGGPFVFLNACQVGSGSDELHQYSGLAAAFLAAGASGVIAPLWSVKDEIARDVAVGFYAATVEQGLNVGEAIRRERVAFADEDGAEPTSATFMAYQYFGHPALRLTRVDDGRQ